MAPNRSFATPSNDTIIFLDLDGNPRYEVNYIGELELGICWEKWACNDNYHFSIQARWEEQVWINYMCSSQALDDTWQNLSLHSLNLKLRFDF